MDTLTNAILLKDAAPRSHVAVAYGVAGLLVGILVFGKKA